MPPYSRLQSNSEGARIRGNPPVLQPRHRRRVDRRRSNVHRPRGSPPAVDQLEVTGRRDFADATPPAAHRDFPDNIPRTFVAAHRDFPDASPPTSVAAHRGLLDVFGFRSGARLQSHGWFAEIIDRERRESLYRESPTVHLGISGSLESQTVAGDLRIPGSGFSEEDIENNLEKREWDDCKATATEEGDRDICIMCQDDIVQENEAIGVLRCRHEFHASCIKTWLLQSITCPLCKEIGLELRR